MNAPVSADRRGPPLWLLRQQDSTTRQWKSFKRSQLRRLRAAFDALKMGCAYMPMKDSEIGRIEDAIKAMEKACSVKEWGR